MSAPAPAAAVHVDLIEAYVRARQALTDARFAEIRAGRPMWNVSAVPAADAAWAAAAALGISTYHLDSMIDVAEQNYVTQMRGEATDKRAWDRHLAEATAYCLTL